MPGSPRQSAWVILVLGLLFAGVGVYLTLVGGGILAFTQTVFVGLGLALIFVGFGADQFAQRKGPGRPRSSER